VKYNACEVSLRHGTPADALQVAQLFIGARAVSMSYLPEMHTDEETRQWMQNVVFTQNEVWVAEQNTEQGFRVVGFMALHQNWLEHLYVESEMQGRGIGSLLLEQAKRLRPTGFQLWVFQRNDWARSFYKARGLSLVKLTDGHHNEEREPDALYQWSPNASPVLIEPTL
jgi:GNAT superfamily N-acetyltransferase